MNRNARPLRTTLDGVQQKPALARQQQRVNDPEHGIGGIRTQPLPNPAQPGLGVPLGAKVAATEVPAAALGPDVEVCIRVVPLLVRDDA